MIKTVLSNRIEELVLRCIVRIQDPDIRALVLVPDAFFKSHFQLECIKYSPSHTFFGVDILPLELGVQKLLGSNVLKAFASRTDCLISSFAHIDEKAFGIRIAHYAYLASQFGLDEVKPQECKNGVQQVLNDPNLRHMCSERLDTLSTVYDEVHLLGFSSLHSFYHRLFNAIATHIPVSSYVLSPCMMFWTDMYVKKNTAECEPFYDHYPLLANCGKVARDYARLLEDGLHLHEEAYILPEWAEKSRPDAIYATISSKKSALAKLQADLLLLQDTHESVIDDDTIQVHAAPTLLGQVQALHDALALLSEPIDASDILILAPDIQLYEPYLQRVFDEGQIHVFGKREFSPDGVVDGFLKLLELLDSRWAASDVLSLFYCGAFLKKLGLKKEDVSLVKTCMQRLGVYWAVTAEQKRALVGANNPYEGTFEEFQETFLQLWIENQHPKVEIAAVDAEKIGLVLKCVFSLYEKRLGPATLSACADILEEILESYFSSEDIDEYILVTNAIQKIRKSALAYGEKLFSQDKVILILRQSIHEQCDRVDTMPKGMISCASLGQFRALSVKVVAILGMDESRFPRNISSYALDKHLFLEALISARSHVLICYQNYDFEQQSALKPCSAVMDLLHSYPVKSFSHPIDSYDMTEVVSVENRQFFASKNRCEPISQVKMSYLNKVARSPLNPYFQSQGINLYEEKLQTFGDEFATLSSTNHNQVKKSAFFMTSLQAKEFAELQCKHLPRPIQKAYSQSVVREYDELHEHAKNLGITDLTEGSITFLQSIDRVCEVSSGVWQVPAITIDGISVTGRVEHTHKEGHFAFFGKDVKTIIGAWPRLVAISYAARHYDLPVSSDVLFLQTGVKKAVTFADPEASLKEFLEYIELCQKKPLCLYPDWIDALLAHEIMPEAILDRPIRDPYLQFYMSKCDKSEIKAEWPVWHALAKKLFHPFIEVLDEL